MSGPVPSFPFRPGGGRGIDVSRYSHSLVVQPLKPPSTVSSDSDGDCRARALAMSSKSLAQTSIAVIWRSTAANFSTVSRSGRSIPAPGDVV